MPKAVLGFHLARWIGCRELFIMENFVDIACSLQSKRGESKGFESVSVLVSNLYKIWVCYR